MNTVWDWLIAISTGMFILTIFVGNFIRIWYWIKCRKIKTCKNKQCRARNYCHKYVEVLTEEDIKRLQELINQL